MNVICMVKLVYRLLYLRRNIMNERSTQMIIIAFLCLPAHISVDTPSLGNICAQMHKML